MLIKIKAITSFYQQNASGYVFDPCFSGSRPVYKKIQRRNGNKKVA